ncbi:MAG: protein translocase subunit SecD [Negativicutes bacterium]|nr:protein translocase subunit SecD [Negativicutes bacterium]
MRKQPLLIFLAISIAILGAFALYAKPLALSIKQGLDLQGGTHVVLKLSDTEHNKVNQETVGQVYAILEKRVNELGLTEPIIQQEGTDRIIVELPGINDPDKAIALIGKTAQLEFRDPAEKVLLTGADLKNSSAALNTQSKAVVHLEFTDEGAKKFADATRKNLGKQIGIYLDGEELTKPTVQSVIEGGKAEITGQKDLKDAQNIALLLRSGALPVKVEVLEIRTIGPTLGEDSKVKSERAFAMGIAAVFIFLLVMYRIPGLIADIALVLYVLMTLGALILLNATLTLPGIAGIILSIGMAVDANVLIFERFKEELQAGKTLRAAMELGFSRAFNTIVDSNMTSFVVAIVLFYFGSGPVKGFAVTLAIGNVLSMFTAVTVTRYLLITFIRSNVLKNLKFYGG